MAEFGDHWTRKLRTYFKRFDKDGDGVLTEKDFRMIGDNIIKVGQITGARADEIRRKYAEMWARYYQPVSTSGAATCEEMIANLKKVEKKEMRAVATEQFNLLFDIIDTNQDGCIQLEEFTTYYNIVGVSEQFARKSFDALDTNHDGVLSRDEFVTAGLDFFTLEEPSLPADLFYGYLE